MLKSDLVTYLANAEDLGQFKARSVVDTLLDLVLLGLIEDGQVKLHNFGVLEVRRRRAHRGHNPKTGELVLVPAKKSIKFRPGDELLRRINLIK